MGAFLKFLKKIYKKKFLSKDMPRDTPREPIKRIGLSKRVPKNPKYFKQCCRNIFIPMDKRKIGDIVSIVLDTKVYRCAFIKTPCWKSLEGKGLSGKTIIIGLSLNINIEYMDDAAGKTYSLNFKKNISDILIQVPSTVGKIPIEYLSFMEAVNIKVYTEDISVEKLDEETIWVTILYFIQVVIPNKININFFVK